jgi:hypothetical protein
VTKREMGDKIGFLLGVHFKEKKGLNEKRDLPPLSFLFDFYLIFI